MSSEKTLKKWRKLVSDHNWAKGELVSKWINANRALIRPQEAFVQQVGGITAEHAHRLHLVHQRFAAVRELYPKLHWAHFLAALDWDDARHWLEVANEHQWTVAEMRQERWQTHAT